MKWVAVAVAVSLVPLVVSFVGLALHMRDHARRALPYTRFPQTAVAFGGWWHVVRACIASIRWDRRMLWCGALFAYSYLWGDDVLADTTDDELRRDIERTERAVMGPDD